MSLEHTSSSPSGDPVSHHHISVRHLVRHQHKSEVTLQQNITRISAPIFGHILATYNSIIAMTHPILALLTIGLSICIVLRWQSTGPWKDFFQLIIVVALSMKVLAWIIWATLWEGWEWVEDDDDEDEYEEREMRDYWRRRDEEEMSGMVGSVIDKEEEE